MDDILKLYGIEDDAPTPKTKAKKADRDVLKLYGIEDVPTAPAAPPERPRVMIGSREVDPREITPGAEMPVSPPGPGLLQSVHQALDPATVVPRAAGNYLINLGNDASAGFDLLKSGVSGDDPNYGPRFPSTDPASWSGGRVLKTLGGALATAASPVTAASKTLVTDPLTPIVGPDAADKLGLLLPVGPVGKTGGAAAKAVSPTTRGINKLVEMVGPENVPAMVERARTNPRLRPMDVDDTLRVAGQGLIDPAQPKAMAPLVSSVKKSASEATDAVRGVFDAGMGVEPKILEELDKLSARSRAVGAQHINPALRDAKPVNVTPVVEAIDAELSPGVQALVPPGTKIDMTDLQKELLQLKRKLTDGNSLRTDPDILHDVQSKLRERAQGLMKSASGSDVNLGKELMDYRQKLVKAIDASTPDNQYTKALAKYKDSMDIQRSFEQGMEVLKNTPGIKGVATRPDALERWVAKATPEELEAYRIGARDAIAQKMRSFRFEARRGTDIGDIDFNRQKMEILFGKDKASAMFKALQDERDIALTNSKMLHGSKTAETLAAQRSMAVRNVAPPSHGLPGWASLAALGAGSLGGVEAGAGAGALVMASNLAKRGYQKTGQLMDLSRNGAFARAISSEGSERDALLTQLMSHPKVVREQNKLRNLITTP